MTSDTERVRWVGRLQSKPTAEYRVPEVSWLVLRVRSSGGAESGANHTQIAEFIHAQHLRDIRETVGRSDKWWRVVTRLLGCARSGGIGFLQIL